MKTKVLLLLIVYIGCIQNILATNYPITPRPLRKLIEESKYIVIANVIKTVDVDNEQTWSNSRAVLEIREVLQGKIKTDTIYVYYYPGMICPAPANYQKGTTVLAFLDKNKKNEGFSTHALSYGSKTLEQKGIKLYKSRIQEMQAIQKIRNKEEKLTKTLDWLIRCASHQETRWEGTYELSPESDFMSFYDRDKETFIKKYELSDIQKTTLRKVLFSDPEIEYSDLGLVDLVAKPKDTEVADLLIKSLKNTEESIWYASFLMVRISHIMERNDLLWITEEVEKSNGYDQKSQEKRKQLIKEFIERI
ncbi:hypothetical protein [Aquimarina rubra]|uniref:DUF4476 domain-containing protein n=1 Tax=Aquimarina rubra TaxID=1920033 RepID=A0ABW5LL38_9FLAO